MGGIVIIRCDNENLNVNYVYELPFFQKQSDVVGKLLGGWQFNGIATYNSGIPFTAITAAYDPAGLGILNTNPAGRPNVLCNPNVGGAGTLQNFFNTSCF